MKRFLFILTVGLMLLSTACQAGPAPTPTETATAVPPAQPVAIATTPPTWTPTPEPSPTPASSPTPANSPTPEATSTPAPVDVWVEAVNGLNLRAEAKADAPLVAVLKYQQHLAALGPAGSPDAGGISWQNVRTDDNKAGFVSAQYISTTRPVTGTTPVPAATVRVTPTTPVAATTPATTTASLGNVWVIATNGLNLRAQPNMTAAVVATLAHGQRLTALAPKTAPDAGGVAWQNVRTEANQTGWVSAEFLGTTPPVTSTVSATSTLPAPGTVAPGTVNTDVANQLLTRINELRHQNKVSPAQLNAQLVAAAQSHSQDMARTGNVSQTGSDGSIAVERMRAAGYPGEPGEEVFDGGQVTLDEVWYYWLNDRTSSNILLNPTYVNVGIAVVNAGDRSYYTVDFGKS